MTKQEWEQFGLYVQAGKTECRVKYDTHDGPFYINGMVTEQLPYRDIEDEHGSFYWETPEDRFIAVTWFTPSMDTTTFPISCLDFYIFDEWWGIDDILMFEPDLQ